MGGGTYGKIEAAEKAISRAETEPFQSRWMLRTLLDNDAPVDGVGVRPIATPSQHERLHWIDRGKSLALVTENAWLSRGMACEIGHAGDLTVRFLPAPEEYPTTVTCTDCGITSWMRAARRGGYQPTIYYMPAGGGGHWVRMTPKR